MVSGNTASTVFGVSVLTVSQFDFAEPKLASLRFFATAKQPRCARPKDCLHQISSSALTDRPLVGNLCKSLSVAFVGRYDCSADLRAAPIKPYIRLHYSYDNSEIEAARQLYRH